MASSAGESATQVGTVVPSRCSRWLRLKARRHGVGSISDYRAAQAVRIVSVILPTRRDLVGKA